MPQKSKNLEVNPENLFKWERERAKKHANKSELVPFIKIAPNYICTYEQLIPAPKRTMSPKDCWKLPNQNKPGGLISTNSAKKLKSAVNWLLELAEEKKYFSVKHKKDFQFKVNFITLTLPAKQFHDDNFIKENCLNQFLTECRQQHHVKHYIWRAESQLNGNIHFHIATSAYIHHSVIRKVWNRIMEKYGYVTAYSEEMQKFHKDGFKVRKDLLKLWPQHKQERAYREAFQGNWTNPNSTDVHSVNKIKDMAAYLAKYCSKNPKGAAATAIEWIKGKAKAVFNPGDIIYADSYVSELYRSIGGRLWGCSYSLTKIDSCIDTVSNAIGDELTKLKELFHFDLIIDKYFQLICVPIREIPKTVAPRLWEMFTTHLQLHRKMYVNPI